MRYLERTFSVTMGGASYRDGWERTFRGDMDAETLPAGAPDPQYEDKAREHAEVLRAQGRAIGGRIEAQADALRGYARG